MNAVSQRTELASRTPVFAIETGVAFLTGVEIAEHRRMALRSLLLEAGLVPLDAPATVSGTYYRSDSEDHGSAVLPSGLASCRPELLEDAVADAGVPGWSARGGELTLHDYGVGTATLVWTPDAPLVGAPEVLHPAVRTIVDATADLLAGPARSATGALTAAAARQQAGDGVRALLESAAELLPAPGAVLWVWTHIRCVAPGDVDHLEAATAVASEMCPNDFVTLRHRDHTFASGVAVSVTCSRPGHEPDGGVLSRIIPRQDAWWTLLWALDRSLLILQRDVDTAVRDLDARALAERARLIERVRARISLLRSRVDSVLVSAGARELAVWRSLAEPWFLDVRTASVERKLDALHSSYQAVLEEGVRRRTEQVSTMIYVFTAVSVVASIVAVVQYAQGDADGQLELRIGVLVVCVLAAVGAVMSTLRVRQLRREARPS